MAGWLHRIQHIYWEGRSDTEEVIRQLMEVVSKRKSLRLTKEVSEEEVNDFVPSITTTPLPAAPLEIPQGGVLLDSPFYIQRKGEKDFIGKISSPKALLRIRGPRQYGKTSMLSRIVAYGRDQGFEVVSMDFQNFSELTLKKADNLIWEFLLENCLQGGERG